MTAWVRSLECLLYPQNFDGALGWAGLEMGSQSHEWCVPCQANGEASTAACGDCGSSSLTFCAPGREGPLCGTCATGFARVGSDCQACKDVVFNVVGGVGVMLGLAAVLSYAVHSQRSKRGNSKLSTTCAVRIGLTFWQLSSLTLPVRCSARGCGLFAVCVNSRDECVCVCTCPGCHTHTVPSQLADTFVRCSSSPGSGRRPNWTGAHSTMLVEGMGPVLPDRDNRASHPPLGADRSSHIRLVYRGPGGAIQRPVLPARASGWLGQEEGPEKTGAPSPPSVLFRKHSKFVVPLCGAFDMCTCVCACGRRRSGGEGGL